MPATRDSLLIVTDLDGTLLDETSYSLDAAREALEILRARAIPVVVATSKTRRETQEIANAMGGDPILIVENGGQIVVPALHRLHAVGDELEGPALVVDLGVGRGALLQHLAGIATDTGAAIRAFSQLSAAEVAGLTGLSLDAAWLALDRHFDEPFLLEREADLPAVERAARLRGLAVTRGGRFLHLSGASDKGTALQAILRLFHRSGRHMVTVGLGDAPNDLPFLRLVDRPVLMPCRDGQPDPELAAALRHAERAPRCGPEGWNLAVLAILAGRSLEPV